VTAQAKSVSPAAGAAASSRLAAGAPAPIAVDPWRDRTLQALHSTFPKLFDTSVPTSARRIAIVLSRDGSVFRSAMIDSSDTASLDRLFDSLGVPRSELESGPRIIEYPASADHPDDLQVMLGVGR